MNAEVEYVCRTCGVVVRVGDVRQPLPKEIGPWTLCTHVAAVYPKEGS